MSQLLLDLMPMIIVSMTVIVLMLVIAIKRCALLSASLSFLGLLLAFIMVIYMGCHLDSAQQQDITGLKIDGFTLFYMGLILISSMACVIYCYAFFHKSKTTSEEFYLLLLLATVGALLLSSANHLAYFFIGLELLSVPSYAMLAYIRERKTALDAGLKYLILSAAASATLLFGFALLYAQFATMNFSEMLASSSHHFDNHSVYFILGMVFVLVAIAFKLSLAPFHQWAPDVYATAPVPAVIFLATVSKIAVFAILLRLLFSTQFLLSSSNIYLILIILSVASILLGNLLAFKQHDYLRILGLSAVAHMGYMMIAIISDDAATANFYMAVYVLTSLGAFGVINFVNSPYHVAGNDGNYRHFKGLFWKHPWIASVMTVMLLSLVGVPLTAGFMGKLQIVFSALTHGNHWALVLILVVGSGISIFYYLRSILNLYGVSKFSDFNQSQQRPWLHIDGLLLIVLLIMVILIGLYPAPLLSLAKWSVLSL